MIKINGKYYLYRHIRLDTNKPFYIGIGSKYRNTKSVEDKTIYNRAYNKVGRNKLWWSIVNKSKYKVEIILESDNYYFIKQKEIEFIKLYGRKDIKTGILANLTDGGEGILGAKQSQKTRNKISTSHKGKKPSKEHLLALQKGREKVKKEIIQYDLKGNFIKEWDSIKSAANYFKLKHANISANIRGISSHSGFYLWRYKTDNYPLIIDIPYKIVTGRCIKYLSPSYKNKKYKNAL